MTFRPSLVAVLLSLGTLLSAACAPTSQLLEDYTPLADVSELTLDESELPTLIFKRDGAPGLDAYDRFIIDPVRISYTDPEMEELSVEQVAEMQAYLRDELVDELESAGYTVGTRSEVGTLRLSFTIVGLRAGDAGGAANIATMAAGTATGVPAIFVISTGEVTVECEFRDAYRNRLEAVAIERSKGSTWLNDTPWSTWADVRNSFDQWARGIREAVDEAHRKAALRGKSAF